MSQTELDFMILVWGGVWLITFGAIFYIIGRWIYNSIVWTKNHIRALWRRRNLKLVHSEKESVPTYKAEGKLKIVS